MNGKYCTSLLNDLPKVRVDYKLWTVKEFYICGITGKPCIARRIEDRTSDGDIFAYGYPKIEKDKLSSCPAWNIPQEKALELLELRVTISAEKERYLLESKLKGGKK